MGLQPASFTDRTKLGSLLILPTLSWALGKIISTAPPTHLKCSLYVYSACLEQPVARAVLFQSHFQNSCKIVLFSWNVQEKTESDHGRKYMIFRFMAKNSYTEFWVPSSISLESGLRPEVLLIRRTGINLKWINLGFLKMVKLGRSINIS